MNRKRYTINRNAAFCNRSRISVIDVTVESTVVNQKIPAKKSLFSAQTFPVKAMIPSLPHTLSLFPLLDHFSGCICLLNLLFLLFLSVPRSYFVRDMCLLYCRCKRIRKYSLNDLGDVYKQTNVAMWPTCHTNPLTPIIM